MSYCLQKNSPALFEKIARYSGLDQLLDAGLALSPDSVALIEGDSVFTFRALDAEANRIAQFLVGLGVERGDRVLVSALKSSHVVAVAIAVWRLGAVYVPIDQEWPKGRFDGVLKSIEPRVALLSERHAEFLDDSPVFAVAQLKQRPWSDCADAPVAAQACSPSDTAYIMHTSGSTGEPKGVVMSHGAVVAYFHGHNQLFRFSSGDVCLNNAPFHFDVSIQDVFLPLFFGATVCLTTGMPFPDYLIGLMARHRVTHLIVVASLLMSMSEDLEAIGDQDLSALKLVMTGAEVCDPSVLEFWSGFNGGLTVLNGYGPTEVNSISVIYVIAPNSTGRQTFFPIGKPLDTVAAYLVDSHGEVIDSANVPGELVLGGPQLMDGYWRRPVQTDNAFLMIEGERYYRTGDICHRDAQGDLVFVGRKDKEVKINGRRIHLGEIESVIAATPGVRYGFCCVMDMSGAPVITSIVCPEPGVDVSTVMPRVGVRIEQGLPHYMHPAYFGYSRDVTLGSTGKTRPAEMFKALHSAISASGSATYLMRGDDFQPMTREVHEGA